MADSDRNHNALLIAAAIVAAPQLRELKDTPALRYTVSASITVAEFMLKMVKDRFVGFVGATSHPGSALAQTREEGR
jgi:hypothetical protein